MWRLVFPVLRKSENWYPELRPYGSSDYQALSMNAKLKYNYIFKGCFKTDGSLSVGTSLYLGSLSPQLPFGSIFKLSGYLENVSGYWNICSFCQFSYGFRSTKGSFFLASSDNWALSPSWVFPIQDAFELTRERCYNHKWLEIWVNYKPAFLWSDEDWVSLNLAVAVEVCRPFQNDMEVRADPSVVVVLIAEFALRSGWGGMSQ